MCLFFSVPHGECSVSNSTAMEITCCNCTAQQLGGRDWIIESAMTGHIVIWFEFAGGNDDHHNDESNKTLASVIWRCVDGVSRAPRGNRPTNIQFHGRSAAGKTRLQNGLENLKDAFCESMRARLLAFLCALRATDRRWMFFIMPAVLNRLLCIEYNYNVIPSSESSNLMPLVLAGQLMNDRDKNAASFAVDIILSRGSPVTSRPTLPDRKRARPF